MLTVHINGRSVGVGEITEVGIQYCVLTVRTDMTLARN